MSNDNIVTVDGDFTCFLCPHCGIAIAVLTKEINCGVFRCGVVKATQQPIPPHAPKKDCDHLVANNLVTGCAKPFELVGNKVQICGYK
ncbi:hypothetical protein OAM67_01090 [bacterium]|nr:hypothetical protein [bacterium]